MTMHLSADDLASAVDGTLGEAASVHLRTCTSCQQAVAELSEVLQNVKSEPVPEPSPLFWDQLSARVRTATADESTPDKRVWLPSRPLLVVGGLAAAVVVMLLWPFSSPDRAVVTPVPEAATADSGNPDVAWQAMSDMAASMTAEDVRTATAPAPGRTSVLSDLSDDERAAFVALLRMEMGEMQ